MVDDHKDKRQKLQITCIRIARENGTARCLRGSHPIASHAALYHGGGAGNNMGQANQKSFKSCSNTRHLGPLQ
ncbi:hypothetical protein SDC9_194477 [bioreactor metagenome]|uniref:Uncharacterized protein n=1 Tax=bioreactor metagenome TaxID=1076179 RepID=A0A645I6K5_9ZZZZ